MVENKSTIGWSNWNKSFKEKELTQTLQLTYNLFNEGKTIDQIIKIRKFKQDSVERQIIELITMGLININKVISKEKIELISKNISKQNKDKLLEIKNKLSEDITWFEIKCVIAYLNSK